MLFVDPERSLPHCVSTFRGTGQVASTTTGGTMIIFEFSRENSVSLRSNTQVYNSQISAVLILQTSGKSSFHRKIMGFLAYQTPSGGFKYLRSIAASKLIKRCFTISTAVMP